MEGKEKQMAGGQEPNPSTPGNQTDQKLSAVVKKENSVDNVYVRCLRLEFNNCTAAAGEIISGF